MRASISVCLKLSFLTRLSIRLCVYWLEVFALLIDIETPVPESFNLNNLAKGKHSKS